MTIKPMNLGQTTRKPMNFGKIIVEQMQMKDIRKGSKLEDHANGDVITLTADPQLLMNKSGVTYRLPVDSKTARIASFPSEDHPEVKSGEREAGVDPDYTLLENTQMLRK